MRELLRAFNFEVELRRSAVQRAGEFGARSAAAAGAGQLLGTGGFASCAGLEIELEVVDLHEGGRNDGVIRRVGRAKYQPLTLERGMLLATGGGSPALDRSLWRWLQSIATGTVPVPRYDGAVRVLEQGEVIATWSFVRGLPSRVRGPKLDAKTGEIAIEELTIAHEGLVLEDA
jgi:phage tail-like protein